MEPDTLAGGQAMKAQLVEGILFTVLGLGALAWSVYGMVRSGGWFLNKEKWSRKPLDRIWSFLSKPAFLDKPASGTLSWKQAGFVLAITSLVFLMSAMAVVVLVVSFVRM
jgi:hypothetical protein